VLAYISFIVALARPQTSFRLNNVEVEGVDIVLALDISGSMKAMDFRPNRLEACKKVAEEFVMGRPTDRIGLVVYAGEAYTQCPVTSDHNTLLGLLQKVKFDVIDDGTAIGDGLGTAINRLRESEAKSKIIILLSDGVNNSGYLDPYSAAEIAKNMGIKVYTIGVGTNGQAPYPTPYGTAMINTEIDERLLKTIAEESGGKYFRATNNDKLKAIYTEIDKMEKTILNETIFENKADAFFLFLMTGVILLIVYILLRYTVFRTYP
jgi:Ca-activated chloride channel family protein